MSAFVSVGYQIGWVYENQDSAELPSNVMDVSQSLADVLDLGEVWYYPAVGHLRPQNQAIWGQG